MLPSQDPVESGNYSEPEASPHIPVIGPIVRITAVSLHDRRSQPDSKGHVIAYGLAPPVVLARVTTCCYQYAHIASDCSADSARLRPLTAAWPLSWEVHCRRAQERAEISRYESETLYSRRIAMA